MNKSISTITISKFKDNAFSNVEDAVAIEEPLEISLAYYIEDKLKIKNISITMRTPGDDEALALGFLFTEGIVSSIDQIEKATQTSDNAIYIYFKKNVELDLSKIERHFYTTSSCGVCGKSSIDAIHTLKDKVTQSKIQNISTDIILSLNDKVKTHQAVFSSTGGLHASALFDRDGNFISLYEDVGRHNALDKMIGNGLKSNSLPFCNHILFLSGRASFELIQKAIQASISIVCAVGAPSSLAVELAQSYNITLIGFLKKESFNVYGGGERVL
jgi:FdhD protein